MADDVASGCWWYLTQLADVTAVVGSFPADDPVNGGVPWIFVRNLAQRMEDISIVKGSGAVALVLSNAGQSAPSMMTSTVRFQRLEVDIWVDPLRDSYGNVTSPSETESRMRQVFTVLDSHLHRVPTDQMMQLWGDLVTVGSDRMTEPTPYMVPDGDGLIRGVAFYSVGTYGTFDPVFDIGGGDSGGGTAGP